MSFLYGLLALGLAAFVQAAPTPENVLLARKYAPQFRFHKDEVYWPSTVDYFLPLVKLVDGSGKAVPQPDKLNGQNVDDAPNQGDGLFLNADINAGKGSFLRGQNPTSSQPTTYTFIVPKANGVVDLYYWLFFPFNEAKKIPLLGQVGDHVGDWERLTVRTVNGVATQVDYHAHSDTGAGTLPWDQIPKFDNNARPVGYIAKGSHGLWSSAGTFTYVNAVVFKLQDVTSDGGVAWDTKDSISPLDYIKTGYTGALEWLNFRGKWGNKGVNTCWWKIFYDGCEIVDGPGGPVRDDVLGSAKVGSKVAGLKVANAGVEKVLDKSLMQGHLSQTLATVADGDVSTYKFYLDSAPTASSFIGLEQRCSFFNETSEETSYTTSYATTPTVNNALDYTINTSACAEGFTIESYTLGLCSSSTTDATIAEECAWSTDRRVLRAFTTGIAGIQAASAVVVEDLDNWEF